MVNEYSLLEWCQVFCSNRYIFQSDAHIYFAVPPFAVHQTSKQLSISGYDYLTFTPHRESIMYVDLLIVFYCYSHLLNLIGHCLQSNEETYLMIAETA